MEALLGRSLTHPHIVTVYAHGVSEEEVSWRHNGWLLTPSEIKVARRAWRTAGLGPGALKPATASRLQPHPDLPCRRRHLCALLCALVACR